MSGVVGKCCGIEKGGGGEIYCTIFIQRSHEELFKDNNFYIHDTTHLEVCLL
jgi:hypothetical protein